MREIKQFGEEYLDDYIEIAYNSYPSFKDNSTAGVAEFKELTKIRMNDKTCKYIGMFEDNTLLSAMRIIDFEMNYFNKRVLASGLASLGVHLMYKKQKIAKEMVDYYEKHFLNREIPIALLLPFTPEFYKKMGYGLGPKMNQFRIKCDRLPACHKKADIRYIKDSEITDIIACHTRFANKTHGMLNKMDEELVDLRENRDNRIIANYNNEGLVDGYVVFQFENGKDDNYTINNIHIREFIYETKDALDKLIGFIRKQDDQVNLVIINTQDEYFAHLIDNPLNDSLNYIDYGNLETNTQAIGVMYKVLDVPMVFRLYEHRNFNNINLKVNFIITDENSEISQTIVHFEDGYAHLAKDKYDITIEMHLVDFSSLIMGCISIKGLYNLGLLTIDNLESLDYLDLAFYCNQKPICNTDF